MQKIKIATLNIEKNLDKINKIQIKRKKNKERKNNKSRGGYHKRENYKKSIEKEINAGTGKVKGKGMIGTKD